jgi:hypothetical protein
VHAEVAKAQAAKAATEAKVTTTEKLGVLEMDAPAGLIIRKKPNKGTDGTDHGFSVPKSRASSAADERRQALKELAKAKRDAAAALGGSGSKKKKARLGPAMSFDAEGADPSADDEDGPAAADAAGVSGSSRTTFKKASESKSRRKFREVGAETPSHPGGVATPLREEFRDRERETKGAGAGFKASTSGSGKKSGGGLDGSGGGMGGAGGG